MTDSQVYADAGVLGAIAGMRSMSTPAIVTGLITAHLLPVNNKTLGWLSYHGASTVTALMATGEIIADKLPFVPNRTDPGPLAVRALSGALGGAAIASGKERSVLFGALLGSCAAIGATYATYRLRRSAGALTRIPDPLIAVAEDALVAACGYFVYRSLQVDQDSQP